MKKLIYVLIAGILLTSCGIESSMCPTYGHNNDGHKTGRKAQDKYSKHRI